MEAYSQWDSLKRLQIETPRPEQMFYVLKSGRIQLNVLFFGKIYRSVPSNIISVLLQTCKFQAS